MKEKNSWRENFLGSKKFTQKLSKEET